jgi:hypothetical protein
MRYPFRAEALENRIPGAMPQAMMTWAFGPPLFVSHARDSAWQVLSLFLVTTTSGGMPIGVYRYELTRGAASRF